MGWILKHHTMFFLGSLLVACVFGSMAPFVRTVSNVDYFQLPNTPEHRVYERFKAIFGEDEFFVIAFEKKRLFQPDNLRMIKAITADLEASPLVRDVISLGNADNIVGTQQYFSVTPFLETIPENREALDRLRREALRNPLYAGNIVSRDADSAAIVVFTHNRPHNRDYRQQLLNQAHRILLPYSEATTFHFAGWTVTNSRLGQYMARDLRVFIPATYVLIGLVVFLCFGNARLMVAALLTISAALVSTMGLFRLWDIPLNNVTTIVPPLVMALALADVVHIFSHLDRPTCAAGEARQALAGVLRKVVVPCFLTTMTTAIGFLTLAVSDLEPIRQFAYLAAAGMVFELFFAFCFLPPLLLRLGLRKSAPAVAQREQLQWLLMRLARFVPKHAGRTVCVGLFLLVGAVVAAARVEVSTNVVGYFKEKTAVRQAIDFVENRFNGLSSLDIFITTSQPQGMKDPRALQAVDAIAQRVEALAGVDGTMAFPHFIKDMHESFHNEDPAFYRIPESRALVAQYLLLYAADDIQEYVNGAYNATRIMVRTHQHESAAQARLLDSIGDIVREETAPDLSVRVTGQVVQDVAVIDALVAGQVKSLLLAVVCVSLVMCLALRSWGLGLLSLLPNVFPILLNFGVMGILGIPLNTATVLIAAVALGIAVDDTIHFLRHFEEGRRKGRSVSAAVQDSLMAKGQALVSSSVILGIGFGILMASQFTPTAYFGALSAFIMLAALVGDLVFLPAVLLVLGRRGWLPGAVTLEKHP